MSEETPRPASGLLLGVVGLALIVGGWQLSRWTPRPEGLFAEVRALADEQLRAKLDGYAPRPPLELPGRLMFFVGLGLFVVGGVKMFRAPSVQTEGAGEKSQEDAPTSAVEHL